MLDAVVVGGGIAGLASAWDLRNRDILVLEASDRLGGRIRSEARDPYWLNLGAHVFSGPGSATGRLCADVGVEVASVPGQLAAVELNGRLVVGGRPELYPLRLALTGSERLALAKAGARLRLAVARYTTAAAAREGESAPQARRRLLEFGDDQTFADWLGPMPGDAEAARQFGSQCMVLSVDARRLADGAGESRGTSEAGGGGVPGPGGGVPGPVGGVPGPMDPAPRAEEGPERPARFEVTTHGGRRGTGIDAVEWAARGTELGVGEILLNSMDADGTKAGFDLDLIRAVRAVVDVPIISGGAGELAHFAPAVGAGADAVLAASVFHFGQLRIGEVKDALRGAGHPVR